MAEAENPKDPDMKIAVYYYENFTGRAEPIILMLKDANVDFEFIRGVAKNLDIPDGPYSHHAMPKLKISSDGRDRVYSQTTSMLQYLGKKFGYAGEDDERELAINQVALNAADIWTEVYAAKKGNSRIGVTADGGATFFEKRAETWNGTMSKNLGDEDYFGGKNASYADFAVLNTYEVAEFMFGNETASQLYKSENLKNWISRMKARAAVKQYYDSEPEPVLYGSVKFKG